MLLKNISRPAPAPLHHHRRFQRDLQKDPEKSLLEVKKKHSGRNNNGHITTRHKGGGTRKQYRLIDFKRSKDTIPAKVAAIEYDPNRTARIALLHYRDGEKRYILAPVGSKSARHRVRSRCDIKLGNALPLANIPLGTVIHNIELRPGEGGKLVRSAGSSAQLMAKEARTRKSACRRAKCARFKSSAARPSVSSAPRSRKRSDRQGRPPAPSRQASVGSRYRDEPGRHPHGGGEARSTSGRPPTTPWGQMTMGKKTRRNKRTASMIVRKRKGK